MMKNVFKKALAVLLSVGVVCSVCFSGISAFAEETAPLTGVTINVYNWGEYIANGTDDSMDINEEFTRQTGIKVNYTTFDSNESLYSKLAGGGANYDIIIPSDYMISKLIQEDMLAELNFDNIPNFSYIDDEFVNPAYDTENKYSVPYTWGLVGLFYNKKYVEEPSSWSVLWDDRYSGKILMFDNPRDAFGIAQQMLGYSLNSTEEAELQEAAALLKQQKPLVQAYVMDQIFDKMEGEEAWLAPYYSGDAAVLVEENEDIGFIIPEEGTNYFVDAICIPKSTTHQAEAEAYINFLCDPEISGANMDYVGYATPISEAKEYLEEDIVENPIYYPTDETIAKTEVFVNLPEDISMTMDRLWAEVKMGGPGQSILLVAIILGFLMVYVAIVFYKKWKKGKMMA
jgi:Spermidine/putrescine-binding periplasmic protein